MRAVDYVTNGFGGVVDDIIAGRGVTAGGPSNFLGGAQTLLKQANAFKNAGLGQFVNPGVQTLGTRGIAGLDQAINFFKAADQAINALEWGQKAQITATISRIGEKAAIDQFARTVYNTAASRFGINPLIAAMRDFNINMVTRSSGQAQKLQFAFFPSGAADALQRVRASL